MREISIFTDGGSRGNPGPGAIAFVVFENKKMIYKFSKTIGKTTNNLAEYLAVNTALEWLVKNFSFANVNFFIDSQLVVNQLTGKFKIKNQKIKFLIIKIKNLEKKFPGKIFYKHIKRRENKIADSLINQILRPVSRLPG
jgi:ribonuclease HI